MSKPSRLIGICIAIVAIAFPIFIFLSSHKEESWDIEDSSVNKEIGIAARSNSSNDPRAIESNLDGTQASMKKANPDEFVFGMSLSELDVFHRKQGLDIAKELSNSETKIKLPPSGDAPAAMTLHELNALHKKQTKSYARGPIKFVQPDNGGTDEVRHVVMTLDELDLMHKEQLTHSTVDNDWVKLPPISAENIAQTLTQRQLDQMISRQQLSAEANEVDDTKPIILPPSSDGAPNITNWGLIELHEQQSESIKQQN